MEIRQVKNFENYYISKDGNFALKKLNNNLYKVEEKVLWRRKTTHNKYIETNINFTVINNDIYRILKQSENKSGYLFISLSENGVSTHEYIHRLVAEAFIGDTMNMDVHHLDHNNKNNDVSNLGIVTHKENTIERTTFNNGIYKDYRNTNKTHKCKDCGVDIYYTSTYCKKHAPSHYVRKYKNGFIEKTTLIDLLTKENGSFTRVGRKLGIADNSVRKWCKKYSLPQKTKEWKDLIK